MNANTHLIHAIGETYHELRLAALTAPDLFDPGVFASESIDCLCTD